MKLRAGAAMIAVFGVVPVAAQQKVPLVLNHLAIVIDSATYHDVRHSPLFRGEFAAMDTSYFTSAEFTGTTRLFGKYNYLAIVKPEAYGAWQVGDIGIALSTEVAGGLDVLARDPTLVRMRRLAPETPVSPDRVEQEFARLFGGVQTVRLAGKDATSEHARFEITQYPDGLMKLLAATDSLPPSNRSNARFLAHFYDPRKLLSYVSGATLAIPVDDIAKIVAVVTRDGVTVFAEGEGAIIKLDGFTLHLIPSFVGAGVRQLQFALTRTAVGNPIYRFGPKSQLRFGPGPIAVWDFTSQ